MALETAVYISDLVATNPVDASDTGASMGDHLKLIKSTIQASFPIQAMKKLTGTTNVAQGGLTTVAHGLTGGKIIGLQVVVAHTTNSGVPPSFAGAVGYLYDVSFDATNVTIYNNATSSAAILGKPFSVLITYEA